MSITASLADHASAHHGVVTVDELFAHGIGRARRERLVADGLLVPVFKRVYRLRSSPDSQLARARAICAADQKAYISGRAGGQIWGVRRMGRVERIEVRVPHFSHALDQPWVWLRRCNAVEPVDIVERSDGIRVASPPRLAFDLAAVLSDLDLESVIEQILDERWCTIPTLFDTGRRLYHPARPGSARFARVISQRPVWMGPADSHHEVVLFDQLRSAGVRGLMRQHALALPGGWTIHADIAVPELRWVIPIDHITWHGGRISIGRDKQNDRQATRIGWTVSRVTDEELDRRLPSTVAELLDIYRQLVRAA